MEITLGQQYDVGEKPTVVLYTFINRHAGAPEKICVDAVNTEITSAILTAYVNKTKTGRLCPGIFGDYGNLQLTRVERKLRIAATVLGNRQREPRCSYSYWTPPRAISGNLIFYRDSGFGV